MTMLSDKHARTHTHTCMHAYIHTSTKSDSHSYTWICLATSTQSHKHTHKTCMHTFTHKQNWLANVNKIGSQMHRFMCVCVSECVCVCVCVYRGGGKRRRCTTGNVWCAFWDDDTVCVGVVSDHEESHCRFGGVCHYASLIMKSAVSEGVRGHRRYAGSPHKLTKKCACYLQGECAGLKSAAEETCWWSWEEGLQQ